MDHLLQLLRRWIRRLKWSRPEGRLALLAAAFLAGGGWLLKQADLIPETIPHREWAPLVLFSIGGVLIVLVLLRLRRLTMPPPDIPQADGPSLRGASSFTPEDGEIFRKLERQEELKTLRGWIRDDQVPVVVVMGASGVGKTSLLRAGVQNMVDEVAYWEAMASQPGKRLNEAVYKQLGRELQDVQRGVFLVDQTEQLGDNQEIFELLGKHLEADPPYGVTWIVAMRREYLPEWTDWTLNLDSDLRSRAQAILSLKLFSRDEAKTVFSILADEAKLTVREEVTDAVIDAAAEDGKVSPVDLSIALQVLSRNPRYAEDPRFLLSVGGESAMLTAYLEGELEPYEEEARAEISRGLLELINLESDRRKAEGMSFEALDDAVQPESSGVLLHAFERLAAPSVRVLESYRDEDDETTPKVRLTHERFIPAIRRLSGAVLSETEKASRLLARRYGAWVRERHERRFLLAGKELRQVKRELPRISWGKGRAAKQEFLRLSAKRRRTRSLLTSLGVAAILMVAILSILRMGETRQRNRLQSWGLPDGMYETLPQVRSLYIAFPITDLQWLQRAHRLRTLEVLCDAFTICSRLRRLEGIPDGVSKLTLDLTSTQVATLAGIPTGVSQLSLDLSHSQVTSLMGIPDEVSQLSLVLSPPYSQSSK